MKQIETIGVISTPLRESPVTSLAAPVTRPHLHPRKKRRPHMATLRKILLVDDDDTCVEYLL